MPFVAVADREAEYGPLGTAESDFHLDDASSAAIPHAAGNHTVNRIIGVVMLSALLVGVVLLEGSPRLGEVQADTEFLISESHFSQSCSWKCNHKFWGKGHVAQSAKDDYHECCHGCPGKICKFPCTDACRQKREKKNTMCSRNVTCMDGVEKEDMECCSRCPGSVCVAQESEKAQESEEAALMKDASAEAGQDITKTCGGDAAGAACQFPFEYQGVQYTTCTSLENDGQPWCITTAAGRWGNCNCLPS